MELWKKDGSVILFNKSAYEKQNWILFSSFYKNGLSCHLNNILLRLKRSLFSFKQIIRSKQLLNGFAFTEKQPEKKTRQTCLHNIDPRTTNSAFTASRDAWSSLDDLLEVEDVSSSDKDPSLFEAQELSSPFVTMTLVLKRSFTRGDTRTGLRLCLNGEGGVGKLCCSLGRSCFWGYNIVGEIRLMNRVF